jgi:hypothetical protein
VATPDVERQRRSRAHRKGDHSLCDPARCHGGDVTPGVTKPVTPRAPQLGTRGRKLWDQVLAEGALQPGERVLLEEACRTTDRLDRLDRLLRGDEDVWLRFHSLNEDGSIVRVVVNNLLAEARQQQVALKQLLAELRQSRAAAPPDGKTGKASAEGKGVAGVADLAAFAATRSAKASG